MTIQTGIEITCDCGRKFRFIPGNEFNSTIKRKPPTECNICRNQKILAQSSLYSNSKSKPAKKTDRPSKIKSGSKRLKGGNIDKQLDLVWSLLVKAKAGGKCIVCGHETSLNSHHIYSRAKISVRWLIDDGICLCVNHHIGSGFSAHKTPASFINWLTKLKGQKFMDELEIKANSTYKPHQFEKEILLKELKKELDYYTDLQTKNRFNNE